MVYQLYTAVLAFDVSITLLLVTDHDVLESIIN